MAKMRLPPYSPMTKLELKIEEQARVIKEQKAALKLYKTPSMITTPTPTWFGTGAGRVFGEVVEDTSEEDAINKAAEENILDDVRIQIDTDAMTDSVMFKLIGRNSTGTVKAVQFIKSRSETSTGTMSFPIPQVFLGVK